MFHFKHFSLYHENSALKISTDAVLLAAFTPVYGVQNLLDIGCGCGVIAFCLAWKMQQERGREISRQEIIGIDIDKDSVDEALKNLEFFPKKDEQHIVFRQQRIQDFAQEQQKKFDLIVSNPPFFVDSLKPNTAQKNVSKHNDNLPFEDLRDAVTQLLTPQGSFYLILPTNESERFEQISHGYLSKNHQLLIQPTPSKPVNRLITRYSLSPSPLPCHTSSLCLRDTNGNMSQDYRQLTEEFLIK
jgi:tRNA1Val (adenine37-N6)-methyltransferase